MLAEAFDGDLRERGRHDPLVHPALALVLLFITQLYGGS
jgi:hypothetical protein